MAADSFIEQSNTTQNKIQSFAFVIAASAAVLFSIGFAVSNLSGFGSAFGGCEIELGSQINPNDAPLASLVRLPGIGIVKADAIVAYRDNFSKQNSGKPAFGNCDDLQKVKGIGPKTVQNICEWLKFE